MQLSLYHPHCNLADIIPTADVADQKGRRPHIIASNVALQHDNCALALRLLGDSDATDGDAGTLLARSRALGRCDEVCWVWDEYVGVAGVSGLHVVRMHVLGAITWFVVRRLACQNWLSGYVRDLPEVLLICVGSLTPQHTTKTQPDKQAEALERFLRLSHTESLAGVKAAVTADTHDVYAQGLLLAGAEAGKIVPAWLVQEHVTTFEERSISLPESVAGACAWAGVELTPSSPEALLAYGDWCYACHVKDAEGGVLRLTGTAVELRCTYFSGVRV